MIVAVIVLALIAGVLGYLLYHQSTHGLIAQRCRRKVLVTLKTGEAFSGVLYAADRDALVLRDAVALAYGPRSENVPVEGEAVILRADVAYMQLP